MFVRPKDFDSHGRRNGAPYIQAHGRPGENEPAGFDPTHGLKAAGMPRLQGGFIDGEMQRKILPEIVRPIYERAKGPRDL